MQQSVSDETEAIVALWSRLAEAHAGRDADGIASAYAADAVIYDLAPPLGRRGMPRAEVAAWLATWDGPITIDAADRQLTVAGAIAYATALTRMRGRQQGVDQDLWYRTTTCLERRPEGWRIVHEHTSVPFHMDGSYRAAIDLRPGDIAAGQDGDRA